MDMRFARKTRQRAQRGAALVEAAVVIPVMLVFLGVIVFTHKSYSTKLDRQTTLRSATLYYASHACTGEAPPGVSVTTETASTGSDTAQADSAAGKLDPAISEGVRRDWNMVRVEPADLTVTGSAVNDRQTVGLQRTISTFSVVGCNEKRYDNEWTKVFEFIKDYAQTGGGFID